MWFFITAIALAVLLLAFFRFRQSADVHSQKPQTHMEISTGIGILPEEIDASKAAQTDRQTGVALPRTPPAQEQGHDGSLASVDLRKVNVSKEVELVWEAGEVVQFQPGAWAVAKDPSEYSHEGREKDAPEHPGEPSEERYSLPQRYGADRLVLMARDPYWVYAYWEVTHEKYRNMYEKHLHDWGLSRPVLRVRDLAPGLGQKAEMDIFLNDQASNWYLNIPRPQHTLVAQLGRLFPDNVFVSFVTSNIITLPADAPSDHICLEWAPLGWQDRYLEFRTKIGISSPWIWRNNTND